MTCPPERCKIGQIGLARCTMVHDSRISNTRFFVDGRQDKNTIIAESGKYNFLY